jgi:hypothetical protein
MTKFARKLSLKKSGVCKYYRCFSMEQLRIWKNTSIDVDRPGFRSRWSWYLGLGRSQNDEDTRISRQVPEHFRSAIYPSFLRVVKSPSEMSGLDYCRLSDSHILWRLKRGQRHESIPVVSLVGDSGVFLSVKTSHARSAWLTARNSWRSHHFRYPLNSCNTTSQTKGESTFSTRSRNP